MSQKAMALYFNNRPPETSGTYAMLSNAVDAAAESYDWVGGLSTSAPKGNVHLKLEALAQDIYVRFGSSATTATTSANGDLIKAGFPGVSYYVSPVSHRYIDHIAAAAGGTLKVRVVSPIGERTDM